jgi:hypothetical protein
MPTDSFSIGASADDGYFDHWDVTGTPPTYPPTENIQVWADHTAETFIRCQKKADAGEAAVHVTLMRFDTSSIPDDATISAAVLKLYVISLNDPEAKNVDVEWYTPSAWPPVDASDYSLSVGTTAGSFALSTFTASTVEDLTLSAPSTVSLSGYTTLRMGISGGTPSNADNYIEFASLDNVSLVEPRLEVTYTSPAAAAEFRVVQSNLGW